MIAVRRPGERPRSPVNLSSRTVQTASGGGPSDLSGDSDGGCASTPPNQGCNGARSGADAGAGLFSAATEADYRADDAASSGPKTRKCRPTPCGCRVGIRRPKRAALSP